MHLQPECILTLCSADVLNCLRHCSAGDGLTASEVAMIKVFRPLSCRAVTPAASFFSHKLANCELMEVPWANSCFETKRDKSGINEAIAISWDINRSESAQFQFV